MDTYKKKYKELVAWINLLSHSALTIDQHKIVDAILERSEKLAESEDEKIRKELIEHIKANKEADYVLFKKFSPDDVIAWLEKQGKFYTKRDVDNAYIEGMAFAKNELEKQGKQKGYTFKSIPRLLDMIEPSDKAKAYCQKLIDALAKEGYNTDAKIVEVVLNGWNGEDVPMAIMDEQKPVFEMKTPEESLGIDSDTYNKIVDECIYGEQKSTELAKGEDYGIDGLWHAQRILEKTLGEVDGYQTDDGILDHKAAITAVKKLYEQEPTDNNMKEALRTEYEKGRADAIAEMQNPAWSEEDEEFLRRAINATKDVYPMTAKWLKFLKDRVQSKQEWSEEDNQYLCGLIGLIEQSKAELPITLKGKAADNCIDWLKSLKPQNRWKPSDKQMKALHDLNLTGNISYAGQGQVLIKLYNDLERLLKI